MHFILPVLFIMYSFKLGLYSIDHSYPLTGKKFIYGMGVELDEKWLKYIRLLLEIFIYIPISFDLL